MISPTLLKNNASFFNLLVYSKKMQTQTIWEEFKGELFGFLKARLNNTSIAEDLLQEVFIKIHTNISSLKEKDKLINWVYQITRNTLIDYYRKNKTTDLPEGLLDQLNEGSNEIKKDFSNCLKSFIPHLAQKDQEALIKTTFEGLTQKEYAEQINLSYTATKSRIQRARQKLKELFIACCNVQTDGYGNVISSNDNCNC